MEKEAVGRELFLFRLAASLEASHWHYWDWEWRAGKCATGRRPGVSLAGSPGAVFGLPFLVRPANWSPSGGCPDSRQKKSHKRPQ